MADSLRNRRWYGSFAGSARSAAASSFTCASVYRRRGPDLPTGRVALEPASSGRCAETAAREFVGTSLGSSRRARRGSIAATRGAFPRVDPADTPERDDS
jgi:hypothetical protein